MNLNLEKNEKINKPDSEDQIQLARKEVSNRLKDDPELAAKLGRGLKNQFDSQMENGTNEERKFFEDKLAGISSMLEELKKSISPDSQA
ncbi:MAG: hypothetical protein V3575_03555 [Candidatus Absconditabacteria bacterium]